MLKPAALYPIHLAQKGSESAKKTPSDSRAFCAFLRLALDEVVLLEGMEFKLDVRMRAREESLTNQQPELATADSMT